MKISLEVSTELPCSHSEFAALMNFKKGTIRSNHTSSTERILTPLKCNTKPQPPENVIFALWKLLKQNKFNFTIQNLVVKAIRIAMHTSHSPQEASENLNHLTALLFRSLSVHILYKHLPCTPRWLHLCCLFFYRALGVCALHSVFRVFKKMIEAWCC